MSRTSGRPLAIALVLAVGLGVLWWTRDRSDPLHAIDPDARTCRDNLHAIYRGLRAYADRFGHAPDASGTAFLGALIAAGIWEDTQENTLRLTCPGRGAQPVPPGIDYSDLESLGPRDSAYAARNVEAHPLPRFPSGGAEVEVLVACDGAEGMNHAGVVNVLFSDGSIRAYFLDRLIADGRLPADATDIPVGPGSPLEELRVLSAD